MFEKGPCEGCRLREETIADLREQLREANKTSLAVIDARAYAIRYMAEAQANRGKPPARAAETPPTSPEEFRRRRFHTPMTSEEVEATFAAEAAEAQGNAGASGPRGVDRQ